MIASLQRDIFSYLAEKCLRVSDESLLLVGDRLHLRFRCEILTEQFFIRALMPHLQVCLDGGIQAHTFSVLGGGGTQVTLELSKDFHRDLLAMDRASLLGFLGETLFLQFVHVPFYIRSKWV